MFGNDEKRMADAVWEREPLKPLRQPGMRYTLLTQKAMQISFHAHRDQTDKGGMPYVFHPVHVAEMLETEEEICTALLHDVVEDTDWTLDDLRREGIPESVLTAIALMTHNDGTPYLTYVARLRSNPIARRVKLADLTHNSDPDRPAPNDAFSKRRRLKYAMAKAILQDDYYDRTMGYYCKRIPLDLERYHFLSVFYDREGMVLKYSLDVEAASDSHYEFDAGSGAKLREYWSGAPSLPEGLADFLAGNSQWSFAHLMSSLGCRCREFHYG
ncbi:MAG: bifunctional (p)ppGpp synthetase/guanosine-3',5'-bis(diphosphate) 3'-pyrophosphohydrolase [Oscillospiraceae bacterium]|nr:bifunctional (p)ppGpp synthetase/guanosine-3',5'-bis(diphosphate) 3'-pyrophosphohydrolase [Oscillospiraceae bacterium]